MPPRWVRRLLIQAGAALLAAAALRLSSDHLALGPLVPVSLAAAVALALLLLHGPDLWIGIAVGAFLARVVSGAPAVAAYGPALLQALQALSAWFILTRVFRAGDRIERARDVVALAAAGAAAGLLAVSPELPRLLREGWSADSATALVHPAVAVLTGTVVFTPALLALGRGGLFSGGEARRRDLVGVMLVCLMMSMAIFLLPRESSPGMLVFGLAVLPLLMFVTLRGTPSTASLATSALALMIVYGTAHHLGPYGIADYPINVRAVHVTLAPIGLFVLLLSSAEMDRRRAIQALSASKAQMERALDASNSGLWEWRADTGRNAYDERVARIFGQAPDTGLHLPAGAYGRVHPEDRERLRLAILDHVEGRTPGFEVEIRHEHEDGGYVWVLDRGRIMERAPDGAPLLMSGTVTDIRERRRIAEERATLEERVLQSQKLESLGLLAGGIAHDFNNILTTVLGHADLARRDLPEDSPTQAHLAQIVAGAHSAADLTRQMLAFAGKAHVTPEPVSLQRLVNEMGQLLQVSISRRGTLRLDLPADLPAVEADAAQMRQVIMNLILNAAEALSEQGGRIDVSLRECWCDRTMLDSRWVQEPPPEGRYVVLEVADDGSGMAPDTLARIFDPFFTTKFTGRGLGLAAVLGIVRGHRGSVQVDSVPERGTSFRVMFPATAKLASTPAVRPDPESWRGDGLALVVDDEDAVRVLASGMLRRLGFEVAAARDGADALRQFREGAGEFRIVLLDLTMPGMNGLAVAREMHALRSDVRVVLMTGYSAPPWTGEAAPPGMAGFLEKPFRLEDVARVLQGALERTADPARV